MNRRGFFATIGAALLALCAPLRRLGSARSRRYAEIEKQYRTGTLGAGGYEWYVDQNVPMQIETPAPAFAYKQGRYTFYVLTFNPATNAWERRKL